MLPDEYKAFQKSELVYHKSNIKNQYGWVILLQGGEKRGIFDSGKYLWKELRHYVYK